MRFHANARLTVHGRLLLVQRVLERGERVAEAAASAGVSEGTAYRWIRRYREEGSEGLEDRSSRPHRSPGQTAPRKVERILRLRRRGLVAWEIAQQAGVPRSTVSRILRRHGLERLARLEPQEPVRRYERERPGELLHLDTKKLARIQGGPGHRIHGDRSRRVKGVGWENAHAAVDDHTRLAFVEVFPDEGQESVTAFLRHCVAWYAEQGIRIERVLTDRGSGYRSRRFNQACHELGIRHLYTRPYTPKTNGKVERFIQTLSRKWAYAKSYSSSKRRTSALPNWVRYYNLERPHFGLGGNTPWQRLRAAA
jgi:transposase InsO family protein